jgi:hypothetical protein
MSDLKIVLHAISDLQIVSASCTYIVSCVVAAPDAASAAAPQEALTVKWSTTDANIATFDVEVYDVATSGVAVRNYRL